jgi:signal transduction histidine kinase
MQECEDSKCVALQARLERKEHEYLALQARLEHTEHEYRLLQGALECSAREHLALQGMLERKEQEHIELQAALERRVEERTARLLEANEQIAHEFGARAQMELELRQAQRLEVVGRLAAGVAHEINTPVQYVSDSLAFIHDGIGDLLQLSERLGDLCANGDPGAPASERVAAVAAATADLPYLRQQMPRAIARAIDGLERVTTIVRSMSFHAHPGGHLMAPTDLNKAIASTLTIACSEYKYVAEIVTEWGEIPAVMCFLGDFNQVIVNLIVNAAHAIADAVGTSGALGRITIKTWSEDPDVFISIADTGGGIPEYVREYIFEPFFTTKELGKGTGQGLAIARAVVVDKHSGSLTFDSTSEGTTFLIRLPIAGPQTVDPASDQGVEPARGPRAPDS